MTHLSTPAGTGTTITLLLCFTLSSQQRSSTPFSSAQSSSLPLSVTSSSPRPPRPQTRRSHQGDSQHQGRRSPPRFLFPLGLPTGLVGFSVQQDVQPETAMSSYSRPGWRQDALGSSRAMSTVQEEQPEDLKGSQSSSKHSTSHWSPVCNVERSSVSRRRVRRPPSECPTAVPLFGFTRAGNTIPLSHNRLKPL